MKQSILLLLCIIPMLALSQKVVILSVNQPPEFGFSISRSDTTILKTTSVVLGTDLVVYGGSGEYQFHWSPSETLNDPSILNPVATPLDTTTYLLTVTDNYGCSFSLTYTVNTRGPLVGTENISGQQNLEALLFPNPNDGKFKVRLTGKPSESIELLIFDGNGRRLAQQVIRNFSGEHTETIQVNFTNGIYTLHINSGDEVLSRQFIIQ